MAKPNNFKAVYNKLTKKVTITANKFSKAALEGINKAGAKANILE